MNLQQYELIQRLKRQPKHGDWLDDLKAVFATGGDLAVAIGITADAIFKLNDGVLNLNRGVGKTVGVYRALGAEYAKLAKDSLFLELRNKEINKQFGVNSVAAARLSSAFQTAAASIGSTGIQMQQYGINIRKVIPVMDQVSKANTDGFKSLSRIQQVLTTNLGLSAEQAESYSYIAMQGNKAGDEQLALNKKIADLVDPSGNMGAFKQIAEGLAEATADVQMQYGKIPGNMELAILKAKALGFAMSQLKTTGDKLLQIESSIGDELEYQLLSGHRLVGNQEAQADLQGKSLTNEYRMAHLQRDGNKQAEILKTILDQEGETLENNLLARQQMSQLLGMDEAALSRALQKKSLLEKIGGKELFDLTGKELESAARSIGATEDQISEIMKNEDTRTTDEKLQQVLEQMVETGIKAQLVDQETNVRDTSAKILANAPTAFPQLSEPQLKTLGEVVLGTQIGARTTTVDTLKAVTLNAEAIEIAGTPQTALTPSHDVVSMPGGGGRVLTGPFGAFSLDNRDMVMAGDPAKMLGGGGGGDMSQLANIFVQVGNAIVAAINNQTRQTKNDNLFAPGINGATWG